MSGDPRTANLLHRYTGSSKRRPRSSLDGGKQGSNLPEQFREGSRGGGSVGAVQGHFDSRLDSRLGGGLSGQGVRLSSGRHPVGGQPASAGQRASLVASLVAESAPLVFPPALDGRPLDGAAAKSSTSRRLSLHRDRGGGSSGQGHGQGSTLSAASTPRALAGSDAASRKPTFGDETANHAITNGTGGGGGGGLSVGGGVRVGDLVQRVGEPAVPTDGVYFAHYRGKADSPIVVYRSPQERASNPERLNLDRRHLSACPVLRHEERVRLLNYQNNFITRVEHLGGLPNLIFLDLYNNSIEGELGLGLEAVPTLRVLMLGKNKIGPLIGPHLERLTKLDVLDLHSNAIERIEGLSTLSELRVLNLAGNKLRQLEGVRSLGSLTELNVRRNAIEREVEGELANLTGLQRIFMSNNQVPSLSCVASIFSLSRLLELSMDGNPVCGADDAPSSAKLRGGKYRRDLLAGLPKLKHLDLKRVSEQERKEALADLAREEEEAFKARRAVDALHRKRCDEKQRQLAIEQASAAWSSKHAQAEARSRSGGERGDHESQGSPSPPPSKNAAGDDDAALPKDSGAPHPAGQGWSNSGPADSVSSATAGRSEAEEATSRGGGEGRPVGGEPFSPGGGSREGRHATSDRRQGEPNSDFEGGGGRRWSAKDKRRGPQGSGQRASGGQSGWSAAGEEGQQASGFFEFDPPKHEPLRDDASGSEAAGQAGQAGRKLSVYGEAFECLEQGGKTLGSVTCLAVKFVAVGRIVQVLSTKLHALPRLREVVISENALKSFDQLESLLTLLGRLPLLRNLTVVDNPVCGLTLLRPYAALLLPDLETLNGALLDPADLKVAREKLAPLKRVLKQAQAKAVGLASGPDPEPGTAPVFGGGTGGWARVRDELSPGASKRRSVDELVGKESTRAAGKGERPRGSTDPTSLLSREATEPFAERARSLVHGAVERAKAQEDTAKRFAEAWQRALKMYVGAVVEGLEYADGPDDPAANQGGAGPHGGSEATLPGPRSRLQKTHKGT